MKLKRAEQRQYNRDDRQVISIVDARNQMMRRENEKDICFDETMRCDLISAERFSTFCAGACVTALIFAATASEWAGCIAMAALLVLSLHMARAFRRMREAER